jgi:hypothetical protein
VDIIEHRGKNAQRSEEKMLEKRQKELEMEARRQELNDRRQGKHGEMELKELEKMNRKKMQFWNQKESRRQADEALLVFGGTLKCFRGSHGAVWWACRLLCCDF